MSIQSLVEKITDDVIHKMKAEGVISVVDFEDVCKDKDDCQGACVEKCPVKVKGIIEAGADRISSTPGVVKVPETLARFIDHTLLKPDAAKDEITNLCSEARKHCFASVCINPYFVQHAASLLQGCSVKVCTVIGFPLGATTTNVKCYEAREAIENGAEEVDMVMNVGALKSRDYRYVENDIYHVVAAAHEKAIAKVIIETALLDDEEKVKACVLAKAAGADYVKTSTGFSGPGATVEDVALMRRVVGQEMGVKASGGIRDYPTALKMIEAGATRIGASASVKIIGGLDELEKAVGY